MNTLQRIGIGAAALLLAVGLLAPQSSQASHFRFGSIECEPTGNPGEVECTIVQAWRTTFFFSSPSDPDPGDTVDSGTDFDWDDGTVDDIVLTITQVSESQDWFLGEVTFTHTYSSSGTFTVGWASCCRIYALNNRSSGSFDVFADLEVDHTSAPAISSTPRSSIAPIVGVPQNGTQTFTIPRTDPDGDPTQCRLSTDSEAGGGPSPTNFTVNSDCTVEWDTDGLSDGLWTAQVIIEELDSNGNVIQSVPLDFILDLGSQGSNQPPVCEITDENGDDVTGGTVTATVGNSLTFDVTGTDPDGDDVEIAGVDVPDWGSMSPSLPFEDSPPVTSTFSGTPGSGDTGTEFATYSLNDANGSQTQCSVTIDVVQGGSCDVPTLGQDDIDQDNRTLSNTMQDDEGVAEFAFTTLDNFTVQSIDPSSGFDRNGDTWTWDDAAGDPPTSVDFTLEGGSDNTSTYFLEVTDACDDPGPNTVTFDPAYEFDPAASEAQLAGNAPNPFSGQTTIEFALPEQSRVTVAVYDMMGRKVATLVDGVRSAGPHAVGWNGQSDSGQDLASGVYLLRMRAEGKSETKRMTIIR